MDRQNFECLCIAPATAGATNIGKNMGESFQD